MPRWQLTAPWPLASAPIDTAGYLPQRGEFGRCTGPGSRRIVESLLGFEYAGEPGDWQVTRFSEASAARRADLQHRLQAAGFRRVSGLPDAQCHP